MVSPYARWLLCACGLALAVIPVSGDELEQYREFRLGSSVAVVSAAAHAVPSDLKTVHQRPALLQKLSWHPRYAKGRPIPDVDPVREMVFSFFNDQLFRIAVQYDPARTAGLTNEDLIAALTSGYGSPTKLLPAKRVGRKWDLDEPLDSSMPLAQWEQGDTQVSLMRSDSYGVSFRLLVVSIRMERLAREAEAIAVTLDVSEGPAREAAQAKKQAADAQANEEKTRTKNKEAFRP